MDASNLSRVEPNPEMPDGRRRAEGPPPVGHYDRQVDPIDLRWLAEALYAGRYLIVGSATIALLLATAYLMVATPRFEGTSQLLIESQQTRIFSGGEVAQSLDTSRYMIGQVIDSQIELLQSPRLAERVIRHLGLEPPGREGSIISSLFGWLSPGSKAALLQQVSKEASLASPTTGAGVPAGASAPAHDGGGSTASGTEADDGNPAASTGPQRPVSQREINRFLRGLDVRRVGLSLIIQVKYFHQDPKMAARIANAVAELYLDDQEQMKLSKTKNVQDWLNQRVGELEEQIGRSRREIERYKSKHDLFDTGGQLVKERELADTISQSIAAQANAAAMLAQLREVEASAGAETANAAAGLALRSNVIADYKRQFSQVQRQLATTIARFGTSHPQVNSFRAELKNLETEIANEVARLVESLRNDYEVARTKAELLADRVEKVKQELSSSRHLKIQLAKMEQSAKIDTDLHDSLLARLRETELRRSLRQPEAVMVRYAQPADKPTRPQKALVLVASLMAALVLSVSYAVVNEFFRNTLRNSEQARRQLGISHVVELPFVKMPRISRRKKTEPFAQLLANPRSEFVQQLYVLKQMLEDARHGRGAPAAVIAVLSPTKGDGKSTVAAVLAKYVAQTGSRTLLIDADMYETTISRLLAPQAELHLHDLIVGYDVPSEVVIQPISPNLDFCPSTRHLGENVRSMDVLASARAREFFASARENYDFILVDTPSMEQYVDGRSIVRHCDLIVLVAEWGKTSAFKANAVIEAISEVRNRIEVVVLNKFIETPVSRLG